MRRVLWTILLVAIAGPASAAKSVTVLLDQVPAPPATSAQASAWVDADGTVTQSAFVGVRHDIEADTQAMIAGANDAAQAQLGSDIDVNRLQTDAAYQAQVQARYQSMSPADAMAMAGRQQAQAMADAQRLAADPPAVRAAYDAYLQLTTQSATAGQNLEIVEQQQMAELQARYDARQGELTGQLGDCNECPADAVAKIEAQNKAIWKKKLALADEELAEWGRFFARAKAARQATLTQGQAHMAATDYGAKAASNVMKQSLNAYHLLLLSRVGELTGITEQAVKRGAAVQASAKASGQM